MTDTEDLERESPFCFWDPQIREVRQSVYDSENSPLHLDGPRLTQMVVIHIFNLLPH